MSLYYDEKLDVEKEKRNFKLSEHSWQVSCKITTHISDFNYGSILFNSEFMYTTCFEFRRSTDKTFLYCDD